MSLFLALVLAAGGPKIALNNFEAGAGANAEVARLLTSEFASSLRRRTPATVVTQDDLRTMMGFERQRQLLNCGDSRCLAEIGGALGVDFIVAGALGRLGGTDLFTVRLIDVRKARVARDFERRLRTDHPEALLDAVDAAVTALFPEAMPAAEPVAPAALAVSATSASGHSAAPWIVTGIGGGVAVVGGLLWGLAAARAKVSNGATSLSYAQAQGVNAEGLVGQGLLIGGLAVAAGGVTWGLLSGGGQR